MKQPSNKKQITAPIAKPKTKKSSISAKTSALVKKKAEVSATKTKPTTAKISATNSKTRKIKTSAPTRKIKINDSKKKQNSSAQKVKVETKVAKPKVSKVKAKIKTSKTSPIVSAKNIQIKKRQKIADKVKTEKSSKSVSTKKVPAAKSQPRVSAKTKAPENKKNKPTVNAEKTARLPTNTAIRKAQAAKTQTLNKTKKTVKSQPKTSTKKVLPKISKAKSKTVNVKSKTVAAKKSAKKIVAIKTNKVQKPLVKVENKKLNSKISKIPKLENQKIVAVHLVKKLNLPVSKSRRNYKRKQRKLIFRAEQPSPIIHKPQPKKAKAISSAVFRGEKNRYDFTVFPLDAVFENVPAIYIISRRVVDKSKKAHHALVCIGQTESLLDELKKHKKDKRTKKFAANSISLLREENKTRRLKIETDLKAAHAIRCLYA